MSKFKVGDELLCIMEEITAIHKITRVSKDTYFYEIWIDNRFVQDHSYAIGSYENIEEGEVLRKLTKLDKALA